MNITIEELETESLKDCFVIEKFDYEDISWNIDKLFNDKEQLLEELEGYPDYLSSTDFRFSYYNHIGDRFKVDVSF